MTLLYRGHCGGRGSWQSFKTISNVQRRCVIFTLITTPSQWNTAVKAPLNSSVSTLQRRKRGWRLTAHTWSPPPCPLAPPLLSNGPNAFWFSWFIWPAVWKTRSSHFPLLHWFQSGCGFGLPLQWKHLPVQPLFFGAQLHLRAWRFWILDSAVQLTTDSPFRFHWMPFCVAFSFVSRRSRSDNKMHKCGNWRDGFDTQNLLILCYALIAKELFHRRSVLMFMFDEACVALQKETPWQVHSFRADTRSVILVSLLVFHSINTWHVQ